MESKRTRFWGPSQHLFLRSSCFFLWNFSVQAASCIPLGYWISPNEVLSDELKTSESWATSPIKYNLFPRDTTVLFFHCCDFSILRGRKASQTKQNILELGSLTYCFVVEQNPSSGISFSDIKPAFIRDRYYRCMRNKAPNAQLRHSLYFNTKLSYPFWSIQWQMWPTNEIWKIEPLFVKADFIMCLSLNFKKIDRN